MRRNYKSVLYYIVKFIRLVLRVQVWKVIEVIIEGKTSKLKVLFDTGSTFTVMGYETLKRLFGDVPVKTLPKPVKATLVNGQQITIDAFVDAQIVIKDYVISERIYLSKDIPREVVIEGKRVSLPELIISAPTMETWGIELDLEKGDISVRGGLIL